MTRIRITPDGKVRSLWTDKINWHAIGRLAVRRASYVEFHDAIQKWVVRPWRPRSRFFRLLQQLAGRPFGEILYLADTRQEALRWEQEYYGIGGPEWKDLARR
ncbi:MAG: hypothetical protein JSV19_02570 [Phycisphaerales bacterium]|nr:MAG: hypothetical protein JSV19_02570 [Phycisphaerales bacterium]